MTNENMNYAALYGWSNEETSIAAAVLRERMTEALEIINSDGEIDWELQDLVLRNFDIVKDIDSALQMSALSNVNWEEIIFHFKQVSP